MRKINSRLVIFLFLFFAGKEGIAQRPDYLLKDSILSSLDGHAEVFYYVAAQSKKSQPLVVELHTWSNNSQSQEDLIAQNTREKNWNYILPNYRGINNSPKACCSQFAISDIDAAIDWALKYMHADPARIYIVGYSGGAYATFGMYMKSRHKINSFSAWCGIADLTAWYWQSLERKNKYATDIIRCTDAGENFNEPKARERSPLFWTTPVQQRRKSVLQIYAGIHDGYTGSVPISHSINFYNKLLTDLKVKDSAAYVPQEAAEVMLQTQSYPSLTYTNKIDLRQIHYQKHFQQISLTIFEGGHEILRSAVLELIERPALLFNQ
jgi:poly(3-hydroxybutyrate) depolymerase